VECKNSNRIDAKNADAFNSKSDKHVSNVAKKYFDSLAFLNFTDKNLKKKKIFCYIIEAKSGDIVLRKYLKHASQIYCLLNFKHKKFCLVKL